MPKRTEEPRVKRKKVDERDLVAAVGGDALREVAERYGCGPIRFSGTDDALYERHLIFDDVVAGRGRRPARALRGYRALRARPPLAALDPHGADLRAENPKRVYYLSMEFLLGRSLANNLTNLLLDPARGRIAEEKQIDWLELLEQEPDAGLGNGGLVAWPPASSTRWRRCRSPRWATGSATSTASSASRSANGWQQEHRTTGCAARIPGRSPGPTSMSRSPRTARSRCATGACEPIPGRPSTPDRHPLRSARRRLRRQDHQHAAPVGRRGAGRLRLPASSAAATSSGAGRVAGGRVAHARPLSGRLDRPRPRAAVPAGVFPGRLLARRPRAPLPAHERRLDRAAGERRDPAQRHAPGARGARVHADPAR